MCVDARCAHEWLHVAQAPLYACTTAADLQVEAEQGHASCARAFKVHQVSGTYMKIHIRHLLRTARRQGLDAGGCRWRIIGCSYCLQHFWTSRPFGAASALLMLAVCQHTHTHQICRNALWCSAEVTGCLRVLFFPRVQRCVISALVVGGPCCAIAA